MPFLKGRAKTGGRKKGSTNRNKLKLIEEHIRSHNIDLPKMIFDELSKLSDSSQKLRFLFELYKFIDIYATTRPVEKEIDEQFEELSDEQILELALVKKSNE